MPPATVDPPLRFGRFVISPAERMLRIDGRPAALGSRAFDLLLALVRRRERLVTRQELLDVVWPGVVVEEHNITAQISSLRKLLGPHAIATVPGHGYRFVVALDAPPNEDRADEGRRPRPLHNLPEPRTRFIGREAMLADIGRLLPQTRLLTLTGIGGCGKTRLALQFAQQCVEDFDDGVWFIDLAALKDDERVAAACAAALRLGMESEAPLLDRLGDHLAGQQALIVLDNCEHVREGAAALVDALLARAGRTRVLATSREPVGVAGEQLYAVRSLSLPATDALDDVRAADAVRVFVDRARLVLPEFDVDPGNAPGIVDICRRLDGIALAIELAAARVPLLSVSEIAARLEDRFRLLTGGRSPAERQQTLLATMQWSDDQLEPDEQRMLRALSVFAGGCALDAAVAIGETGDDYEALRLLTALHDKSLLAVERGADRPRYGMLETVRQYAQHRLVECGEAEAARTRHAEHFLTLAEAAAPCWRGPQQSTWMARLREEQENLVAAAAWFARGPAADARYGLRLAAATARYWLFNDVQLGCRLAERALHHDRRGGDGEARCQTLLGLSTMYMHRGLGDAGLRHSRAALAMAQRMGTVEWQAIALNGIGACLNKEGNEEVALRYYERARDLARQNGCAVPLTSALNNIATIDFRRGDLQSAERGLQQALHLARARGDVRSGSISLHNLIRVPVAARRHDDAHASAVEAELLLRGIGEDILKLNLLEVVAGLASIDGEHRLAARLWGASRQRFTDAGFSRPTEDEDQLVRLAAGTRQALGDEAFAEAEAKGRALDVDAAMRELRQWLGNAR
jgi:predicted ATPase/DNA-binding winged helix-turn-helix (wHTH) protein